MSKRPIPNFPRYSATADGKIYGKKGELRPYSRKTGYCGIKLFRYEGNKSIRKGLLVHRLIAKTFIPNPEELPIVNHKNGNKKDNRVENLEWCTYKNNTQHAWDNNLITRHERRVFGTVIGERISFEYDSILEASEMTGTSYHGISKACRGVLKTSGGYEWEYSDNKDQPCEDIETWKIIEDFPNYKVSQDGEIYSIRMKKKMRTYKAGYTRIKLFVDSKAKMRFIHTLVAKAYIPNLENKPIVNHKNGDRHDNRVENLEWVTYKENSQHACDTGLSPKPKVCAIKKTTKRPSVIFEKIDRLKAGFSIFTKLRINRINPSRR